MPVADHTMWQYDRLKSNWLIYSNCYGRLLKRQDPASPIARLLYYTAGNRRSVYHSGETRFDWQLYVFTQCRPHVSQVHQVHTWPPSTTVINSTSLIYWSQEHRMQISYRPPTRWSSSYSPNVPLRVLVCFTVCALYTLLTYLQRSTGTAVLLQRNHFSRWKITKNCYLLLTRYKHFSLTYLLTCLGQLSLRSRGVGKSSTGRFWGLGGVCQVAGQHCVIPYGKWHLVALRWSFIKISILLNLTLLTYLLTDRHVAWFSRLRIYSHHDELPQCGFTTRHWTIDYLIRPTFCLLTYLLTYLLSCGFRRDPVHASPHWPQCGFTTHHCVVYTTALTTVWIQSPRWR